jgi:beta-barrel assembly-enhancing protease
MKRFSAVSFGLFLAVALITPASFANDKKNDPDEIGNRDVGKGVNFYSLEKEIAIGKQLAQEVERQAKIVDDPVIAEYVNRLGQNLVRNSDAKVPFTIKVLDSEEVNAFALPGGFFFVNSGLILKADNEAELAGVMAHEIGHVAARHGTRQATRGQIAQIAMIAASIAIPYGWTGYAIRQGAGLAIPLGFLRFSRAFESEADKLGLEYMYKTGYDPLAFVDFFEKIQSLEKKKPGTMSNESPPPKWTSGLLVWGLGVMMFGDTSPIVATPAFIQRLSFPDRRWAVKPWRIPPCPLASQRRMRSATPINNAPSSIGSQVCRCQPR